MILLAVCRFVIKYFNIITYKVVFQSSYNLYKRSCNYSSANEGMRKNCTTNSEDSNLQKT